MKPTNWDTMTEDEKAADVEELLCSGRGRFVLDAALRASKEANAPVQDGLLAADIFRAGIDYLRSKPNPPLSDIEDAEEILEVVAEEALEAFQDILEKVARATRGSPSPFAR